MFNVREKQIESYKVFEMAETPNYSFPVCPGCRAAKSSHDIYGLVKSQCYVKRESWRLK